MKCKSCHNSIPDGSIFCMYCGEKVIRERRKIEKQEIKIPKPTQLKSGRWSIQLRKENTSATFDTAAECEAWAKSVRAGFIEAEKNSPKGSPTLEATITAYIESRKNILSPATEREYLRCIKTDIPSDLKSMKIVDISSETLQRFVSAYAAKHSPKTVRNVYHLIVTAIKTALPQASLVVDLPAKTKASAYVPTTEDIRKLYEAVKGTSIEIPVLLASTGSLRRSEICALEKSDIVNNGVSVTKAMVKDSTGAWVIKRPKTTDSERVAALPDAVLDKLKALPEGRITSLNPNSITHRFAKVLDDNSIPHFRFHDLRHYWASIARAAGMPDIYIMHNGGWSTMSTPQKVYLHVMADENQKLQSAMNDRYNADFTNDFTNAIK